MRTPGPYRNTTAGTFFGPEPPPRSFYQTPRPGASPSSANLRGSLNRGDPFGNPAGEVRYVLEKERDP